MSMKTMIYALMAASVLAGMTGCKEPQVKSATDAQTHQSAQPVSDMTDNGAKQNTDGESQASSVKRDDRFYVYTGFLSRMKSPKECLLKYIAHQYGELETPPDSVSTEFDLADFNYEDVREARKKSLGKDYETFERDVDALIEAMDNFKPTLEALDRYAKSREYLVDNGAFLKAQNEQFEKLAMAFMEAYITVDSDTFGYGGVFFVNQREWIAGLKQAGFGRIASVYESNLVFAEIYKLYELHQLVLKSRDPNDAASIERTDAEIAEIKQKHKIKTEELKKIIDEMHQENAKVQDEHTKAYSEVEDASLQLLGACRQYGIDFDTKAFEDMMQVNIGVVQPKLDSLIKQVKKDETYKGIF